MCNGKPGLCDAMKPTKGADLLKYLRKVNFTGTHIVLINVPSSCYRCLLVVFVAGLSGDRFHFDGNGDGPARYNIIHFKQTSPKNYRWVKVGEYHEGELRLNMTGNLTKWQLNVLHILSIYKARSSCTC